MTDPRERFTDDEIRRILTRAATRQEAATLKPATSTPSLSLDELMGIAREAGIDATHVQAAARDVVLHRTAPPIPTRLGMPLELREHRVLPGEVSEQSWEQIVSDLRRAFRRDGIATRYGRVREWTSSTESPEMATVVRLEPAAEGTRVSVSQKTASVATAAVALGGTFGFVGLLLGALALAGDFAAGPHVIAASLLLLGVACPAGIRAWFGAWRPKQEARFRAVLDRIELNARPG